MRAFILFCLLYLMTGGVFSKAFGQAEVTLKCNETLTIANLTYKDLIIPEGVDSIRIELRGADGGDAVKSGKSCGSRGHGGTGATVKATFAVGMDSGQLQAGGRLRVFVGQKGTSKLQDACLSLDNVAGGGGGSSAVLYLPPNADPLGVSWHMLGVAGAGGGAQWTIYGYGAGEEGKAEDEALGSAEEGDCGDSNLNGSEATYIYGGGGYRCFDPPANGVGGSMVLEVDGIRRVRLRTNTEALNTGGQSGVNGGDGFTGGGASAGLLASPGGGGGFSGGNSAEGGTSYLTEQFAVANSVKTDGVYRGGQERNGEVSIRTYANAATTAVCQDINLQPDANGDYVITPSDIDGGSLAECNLPITLTFLDGDLVKILDCTQLVQTLSLVVSSSTGQSDNCSATVTLVDNQPPTLTCQNPVIALNKEGNAVLTTSDVSSTISDNCGVKTLSLSRTNFDCSDLGTTTGLSLSAEDYHGNINTCTFNVTVVDELPPIPIAPLDTIFFNCTGSLGNNPPIAFDNCSGTVTGTTSDALTFSAPGVYPINWSFDDGNGNTSIVTEIVVVELNTIYVDQDAPPGGDGSSWATAFKDVDQAMDFLSVTCGDYYPEIWVAEGVYYPVDQVPDPATPDYDPRSKTFYLGRNGLKLYGGFNGTETRRSQRDPDQYVTILDGDIGVQGDASDNAYHIFYMDGASTAGVLITSTIIDGFTIRNGNANGAISSGGAMYIDGTTLNAPRPIIENCRFIANSGTFGGAVYLSGVGSEVRPEFRHCTFSQNTAVVVGAAIYSNGQAGIAAPIIQDCIFEQNTAGSTAGAIYFDEDDEGINPEETSGTVINCRFDQNSPSHIGFDDGYLGSEPVLINCTFTGAAVRAVQIDFWDTGQRPMFFYNCIFWDNNELTDNPAGMSIQNSITGNDTTFAGNNNNFNLDPLFADPTNGDFGLTDVSPALNVGNNVYVTNVSTDLAGQPRIKQGIVDLGAYEYQYAPGPIIYVDKSAVSGNNTGVSWASAFLDLQDAIDAFKATENTQIWVAAGTYYPTQEYDADNSGGSDSRERTFYFNKDGIKMYGGFAGTETLLAQRDPALNPTVLSGDIGTPGDSTDNAYHVLWLDGTAISITDSTLLDGFTIQGGMADGRALHRLGGGVYLNAFGGTVNPRIMNCNLVNNYALSGGAALFADASSGKISSVWQDCVFKDNSSPANGAIYLLGEDGNLIPEFINGLFLNNGWSHITYDDGASGAPNFTNCTFAGVNSMAIQVDFFDSGLGLMKLSNCILWNNNQLTNNAAALYIQNSLTGDDGGADFTGVNGNIQLDPLFADYAAGDLSLEACSPAINIGLNKAIVGISTDLAGNARVVDGTVDAGAYEFQDIALSNQGSGIVYVDINANGNNDGSDWGNAFTSLQDALTLTGACSQASEIWVAAGTYLPTQEFDADGSGGSDPREATFYINRDGIQLYGGFAGTEDARDQRAPAANTTILSGDIGNPGDSNDNAFHVLLIDGSSGAITANTVVDGFTITAGLADGSLANNSGSGVYLKGGISNDPLFSNCRFTANTAGGAIYLSGNTGQIAPAFFNCLFTSSGNAHIRYDDGLTGAPAFTNCTFWGASALAVDIESFDSGMIPLTFANCILWNNNLLTNNLSAIGIQNSIVGDDNSDSFAGSNGNIDQDPLFTAALNGNFQLEVCSPAIDLGDNSALGNLGTDLGGNLRIVNNTVDAGAYEAQTTSFDQAYPVIYVNQNATGTNDGSSWADALTSLQAALDLLTQCGATADIWVAAGVYNPSKNSSGVYNSRNNTFYIKQDGIRLYGGFDGTELELSERNIEQNPTILDGYFQEGDGLAINVYHVVFIDGASGYGPITDATVLDGFTIRNGLADGSGADSTGAGIYINGAGGSTASPTIANCRVESNTAVEGGGIYINAGAGTIESVISNCNFFQNTGTGKGGAISINGASSISCDPLLDGCTFSQNTAGEGGAMYITGNTGPTINYCTFNDNTANLGGAVRNNGKLGNLTPIFITCDFLNNHATSAGGAVNNFSANGVCNTTFTDCIFRENSAADPGGAIMIDGDLGDAKSTFTNCLFERNGEDHIAYNDGNAGQQPEFLNCTFYGVDNTAIHFTHFDSGRTPIVATNCIFWNNVSLAGGTNTGDNDGDVFTNLTIQSSIVGDDIAGVYDGVDGNLQQDPTFADAANSNFYLEDCSPALDAGDNLAVSGVSTDLVGVDRILNGTVDMGALENQRLETLPALGGPIPPGTFITGLDTIRTEGPTEIGAGSSTVFEARKLVTLQAGFHAGAGSIFIARINPDSCEVVPAAREETPVLEQEIVNQSMDPMVETSVVASGLSLMAYPNPFQHSTTLRFQLPAAGPVDLVVYSLQGQQVRTLLTGVNLEEGQHEIRMASGELPAGIYLARLQTAGEVLTIRLACSR